MGRLRLAVVGAGGIARHYHLPSLRRLADEESDLELAAVCDVDAARAEAAREAWGFAGSYTDLRQMLDAAEPDAVWALVPYPAMREIAGLLLGRRVPVLMEKPPGSNAREAGELLAIAEDAGTPHQVAFNRRYAPLIRRMRELAVEDAGPVAASCQFFRHDRREPHFPFGTGLHGLDTLRYLGPAEVRAVHTRPGPRGSALITYEYADGALGVMELLPRVGVQSERYTVHSERRTVVVDGVVGWLTAHPGFLECYEGGRLTMRVENDPETPAEVLSGFHGEAKAFVDALRSGRPPTPGLREALRSVQIAEAVQQGRSVEFPDG